MMVETELCMWCEGAEVELAEEEYGDPNYDKEADATNWQAYGPCPNCGAHFVLGKKFISFAEVTDKGDPKKSVFKDCDNCKWSMVNPEFDALGCPVCVRGEYIGEDHPQATDNWTPLYPEEWEKLSQED